MSLTLSTILPKVDCKEDKNIRYENSYPNHHIRKNRLILSEDPSLSQEKCTANHHTKAKETNNKVKQSSQRRKPP